MSERFFIIDGMAIAYRAHFAHIRNPLLTSDGRHVSATHGFIRAVLKIIKDESPDHLAVAFDSREKTFRHEKYPEYKATREKMPFEMVPQIQWIKDLINAMNIPLIEMPGYEADDIIATLAVKAEKEGMTSYMVTGDKDFMQLVNDRIFMYAPASGRSELTIYDADKVRQKWGVGPESIIDLLALMGDSSDNIPGIPGVGEKTAVKLLHKYGNLENVLEHAEGQKNARVRTGLTENADLGRLSRELVTIDRNVPIKINWDEYKVSEYDHAKLKELLQSFEFFTLIKEMIGDMESNDNKTPQLYRCIDDKENFDQFLNELNKQSEFAFDTETDSTDPFRAKLVGLSFSWSDNAAYYIPLHFAGKSNELFADNDEEFVLDTLKPIFQDPERKKAGQNIKYDTEVLRKYGIRIKGISFDTMVAEYLLNPDSNSYKLDNLAQQYLHYRMQPIEDLIGRGRKQISMAQVPLEKASWYACEDADVTWQLKNILLKKLQDNELFKLFHEIEMPLVNVLIEMEANGMYINTVQLKEMSRNLEKDLLKKNEEIYELAGEAFNINSPAQLSHILFEKIGLKPVKKTKTGYSTDVTVLEALQNEHPLPSAILDYRGMAKLKSTYVDALPELKNPDSGRIHSSFNQTVAATGRLSSTNPNFQNIPIRTARGREIRKAFIAEKSGWSILAADYSQIELRIIAHLSGDKTLVNAFRNDLDIHRKTASLVFNVAEELISEDMRRTAKVINFGIIYGAGPFRISQELNIPRSEAAGIIKAYFDSYPGLQDYIEKTTTFAEEKGYVETLYGRRRDIRDIKSDNRNLREAAKRVLINMPVQGSAADIIKIAMIRLHKKLSDMKFKSMLISQVHDELIFEAAPDEIDELETTVKFEMEHAADLSVPLKVDAGRGSSWFEAH